MASGRAFRSPMCRRATRSSSASRWGWPKRAARATCSSASTRSIIRAIPIAGRSSSPRSSDSRISRPRPGSKASGFTIHAPLQHMTKADIAREAQRLGLDAALSQCCYDPLPDGRALRPVRRLPAARQGLRRGGHRRSDGLRSDATAVKEMLPDACRARACRRAPRGVPALRRLQSVVGPRSRTARRRNAISATPISSAPTARAAASSPTPTSWPTHVAALWGEGARRAAGRDHRRRADAAARRGADRCAARARLSSRGRNQRHACRRSAGIDWICVSPKAGTEVVQRRGDELKLVWPQDGHRSGRARGLGVRPFPGPADGLRRARRRRSTRRSRWRWSGRTGA